MIVNPSATGWDIIFQPSHALLAGKIAMQWKHSERPEPWTDVLSAIIDHDDGQKGWKHKQNLTEAGAPLDFQQEETDIGQAKRTVANARYRSRWIALLTSMHTSALYGQLRGTNQEMDDFLNEQQDYQKKLRSNLSMKKSEAERMYRLVFFCDACSLVLCKNEVPTNGNKLELAPTPDQQTAFIFQKDEQCLSIEPWVFEEKSFTVSVDVFQLHQLSFKSDHALHEALDQAETITQQWTFQQ